jgi:hypothetical protein
MSFQKVFTENQYQRRRRTIVSHLFIVLRPRLASFLSRAWTSRAVLFYAQSMQSTEHSPTVARRYGYFFIRSTTLIASVSDRGSLSSQGGSDEIGNLQKAVDELRSELKGCCAAKSSSDNNPQNVNL